MESKVCNIECSTFLIDEKVYYEKKCRKIEVINYAGELLATTKLH
jgi:hypothetical protein